MNDINSNDSYIGVLCNVLGSSSCRASPCKNGGSCTETLGGYVCKCRDGYTGKNCNVGMSQLICLVISNVTCSCILISRIVLNLFSYK